MLGIRIRIRRVRMFLGLPDPRSGSGSFYLSSSKNSRKYLHFSCFVTSLWLFVFKEWCKCSFKKYQIFSCYLEGRWRKQQDPDPETLVRGMGPRIRIRTKMSRIPNTVVFCNVATRQFMKKPCMQGAVRYCEKCQCIKPDRSHHCSVCEVCTLKMDHHCPWVNNCVGFANYKVSCLCPALSGSYGSNLAVIF